MLKLRYALPALGAAAVLGMAAPAMASTSWGHDHGHKEPAHCIQMTTTGTAPDLIPVPLYQSKQAYGNDHPAVEEFTATVTLWVCETKEHHGDGYGQDQGGVITATVHGSPVVTETEPAKQHEPHPYPSETSSAPYSG